MSATVLVPSADRFKSLASEQEDNISPESSVRSSNRPFIDPHSGILSCACGHDMGQLQWPLAAGIHHLNNRCVWSCCNGSWESKLCSHEFGNVINTNSKYKPWEKQRTYEFNASLDTDRGKTENNEAELLGTLRTSAALEKAALEKANEIILKKNLEHGIGQEISEKYESDTPVDSSESEETGLSAYIEDALLVTGEAVVTKTFDAADGALYGVGVVASILHSNFVQPFLPEPVVIPTELDEILSALIQCDSSDENANKLSQLLASAVNMYLQILELSDSQYLMLESWVDKACTAWKAQTLSRPLTLITSNDNGELVTLLLTIQIPVEHLLDLSACCIRDSRTQSMALKGTTFINWYIMHNYQRVKFTIPEVTGYPLLMERHLSAAALVLKSRPLLYSQHKDLITQSNFTLDRAIQCGIDVPSLHEGCIAGDEECYSLFKEFYKAVIMENNVFAPRESESQWSTGHKGKKDWDYTGVTNLYEIDNLYVRKCSVKGHRNLSGLSFPAHCSRAGRRKVERLVHSALTSIEGEFTGAYKPLFKEDVVAEVDDFSSKIGTGRDWPFGRGVYRSDDQSLVVYVNHIDHLKFEVVGKSSLGRTQGCDIVSMFQKFARACATVEHALYQDSESSFAVSNEFGFLSTCPSKCGTGLEMEYTIKLDNLNSPVYGLHALSARLGLVCSPSQGSLNSTEWNFSVIHRIGCSEVEMMQTLVDGVSSLIAMEKCLEKKDVDAFAHMCDMLPKRFTLSQTFSGRGTFTASEDIDDTQERFSRVAVNPEDDYPVFTPAHTSLMAKHLTPELYASLRSAEAVKAACGWSVSQLIRVGVEVPSHATGILMGGVESYEAYKHLLAPILSEYHGFNAAGSDRSVHLTDLELSSAIKDIKAVPRVFLRKLTFSASRNVSAFPFPPSMSRKQRRVVEFLLFNAFKSLDGDLQGQYVPIHSMNKTQMRVLGRRNVAFVTPSTGGPSVAGGCGRDFPDARGCFMSKSGRIIGKVNDENHMQVIVEGTGKEVESTIMLFAKTMDRLEAALQPNGFCFAHSDRLGYLSSKVEEVGTALRIQISVKLRELSKDHEQLLSLARQEEMTVTQDEDDDESWTFANMNTLCITEADTLRQMMVSVLNISRLESSMQHQRFLPILADAILVRDEHHQKRRSITSAINERSTQIELRQLRSKEVLSNFVVNHRRRSASKLDFSSVMGSLQRKAESEEQQKAAARKNISAVIGARGNEVRTRASFHSVMKDLVNKTPMTPSEKFYLEDIDAEVNPSAAAAEDSPLTPMHVHGEHFVSLASKFDSAGDEHGVESGNEGHEELAKETDPPLLGLGIASSDSILEDMLQYVGLGESRSVTPSVSEPALALESELEPAGPEIVVPTSPESPMKPSRPSTPNLLLDRIGIYKAVINAVDDEKVGVFSTIRSVDLPAEVSTTSSLGGK